LPFLRLTRDRRGFENTFLLHADRPGDRPRLLYWYRTAPGIMLGRSPLDEDAIRTIEDSHPDVEFDWPAILALSEVMTPEDEAPVRREKKVRRQEPPQRDRQARDHRPREPRRDSAPDEHLPTAATSDSVPDSGSDSDSGSSPSVSGTGSARETAPTGSAPGRDPVGNRLLEELVGREIATRLRARYQEIMARIDEKASADRALHDAWAGRAAALNPDSWVTPDAILDGVRAADALYDRLKSELST